MANRAQAQSRLDSRVRSGVGGQASRSQIAWLADSVDRFCASELDEELVELRNLINRVELRFSRTAARYAAFDDPNVYFAGEPTAIGRIKAACRMSGGAAAERVCVGEHADQLEASVEALESGAIGFQHRVACTGL